MKADPLTLSMIAQLVSVFAYSACSWGSIPNEVILFNPLQFLFSFFRYFHSRMTGVQLFSHCERLNNSQALPIVTAVSNTSDYSDRLAGFRMIQYTHKNM
jgi:hypothetical protein